MAKARTTQKHAQRQPEPPCEKRWGKAPCRPINRYWIFGSDRKLADVRLTCACGRRFRPQRLMATHAQHLLDLAVSGARLTTDIPVDPADLWAEDLTTKFGKVGVVPVGTPVLHTPTKWFTGPAAGMRPLAERMDRTMRQANGVGLAANQVGANVRALIHDLGSSAPPFLLNPKRITAAGSATWGEGCLSLNVPGSYGAVVRWKQIAIAATLLDGRRIAIEADEMLSRVLQHELDHLDGIEYVQRMDGKVREGTYAILQTAGVPTEWLPSLGPEVDQSAEATLTV